MVESVFILNYQKKFKHESILVTKKINGISFLDFLRSDIDSSTKEEAFTSLVSTLGAFFRNGFYHYDPILQNFLINQNQKPYQIIFLDFDSISYMPRLSKKSVLYGLSKFNHSIYYLLVSQNNEKLYSRDKMLFYLEILLKSYSSKISIDKAYNLLTQGTVKLLKRKKKLSIKNNVFISRMNDLNISKL